MGLGCGVRLSLSGFDHTIASSIKKQKNSAGQNRLSLLHSHYAHCLSPRSVSRPLLFFPSSCSLFLISITHIQSLFFFSPFSFMTPPTHTHLFIHLCEDSSRNGGLTRTIPIPRPTLTLTLTQVLTLKRSRGTVRTRQNVPLSQTVLTM